MFLEKVFDDFLESTYFIEIHNIRVLFYIRFEKISKHDKFVMKKQRFTRRRFVNNDDFINNSSQTINSSPSFIYNKTSFVTIINSHK